jgi:hypothetical protein
MNLLTLYDKIDIPNIHFLETKKNMIIDGTFTKIVYTHSFYTMNGLYFHLPEDIQPKNVKPDGSCPSNFVNTFINIYIDMNNKTYQEWCSNIEEIERSILYMYSRLNQIDSDLEKSEMKPNYLLQKQFKTGFLKTYKEHLSSKGSYILKISGVWETSTDYGITYKIIRGIKT